MTGHRKKRVFIGSSMETKELAKQIKKRIEQNCDCFAWYDDFFEVGNYVYNDLLRKAITYDYAILIGGEDDRVIRIYNQDEKISPRDNIYLEYGMFSGILSTNRILFLLHSGCRVASDLKGMTLAEYSDEAAAVDISEKWIHNSIEGLRPQIFSARDIELLPTVGISVGYFYNFVQPFLEILASTRKFVFEGREYPIQSKKLIVNIPAYLESGDHAIAEYQKTVIENENLENALLGRYRILINPDDLNKGQLIIYDVPSTLLSVFKTIDYVFDIQGGIDTEDSKNAKFRALDNFCDNLVRLMEGKQRLSKYIEFRHFDA